MGQIRIETWGSFPKRSFQTCAEEGGHVMAIKRAMEFLAGQLGPAVQKDAELTVQGVNPPRTPLGEDNCDEQEG